MNVSRKTKNRKVGWPRRVLLGLLVVGLLSSLPVTAFAAENERVAYPKAERPVVTVQGNAVIDDAGKPTGFYELALCVQTKDIIRRKADGEVITRAEYEESIKKGLTTEDDYTFTDTDHSFRSVAATLTVNTDILTPVTWEAEYPEYDKWNGTAYVNFDTYGDKGVRGIDPEANAEWMDKVPNITTSELGDSFFAVSLDTAKPDEVNVATARVEGYDEANRRAIITMAGGIQLGGREYSESTPVVVIRFAYDLKRFPNVLLEKKNEMFSVARTEAEGKVNTEVLTYLSADDEAAASTNNQSVWYEAYTNGEEKKFTAFYYYLDGDAVSTPVYDDTKNGDITVKDGDNYVVVAGVKFPKTAGKAVLASDPILASTDANKYSYFHNLLKTRDKTLRMTYVNQPTYRRPAGSAGVMVIYYDWDDKLIGTQIVSPKGDVRAQVNEYVEKNFIHPDLRASQYIDAAGDDVEVLLQDSDYVNLMNSTARDETYRGKYAYTVGEDTNTDKMYGDDSAQPGSDYPLTNKLDYVFYRRVNRITEQTYEKNGKTVTDNYISATSVADAANGDAALYPYVYGWAIVEDSSARNKDHWQVRRDAAQLEDTWTTFGVGELAQQKPNAAAQALPAAAAGVTERLVEPAFLAELREDDPTLPGVTEYTYSTSTGADNGYFRFADFSDIGAEVAKYQTEDGKNKDTLIVKAVYEPGDALVTDASYRMIQEPYYSKFNELSASQGGAYSIQITMERTNTATGMIQGVSRVRLPVVRQDTTTDQKWIQDSALGIDHNLSNPSVSVAKARTETTFTKVDVDNGDEIQFTMSLSARQNKVNYFIVESYGYNFIVGGQRSETNYNNLGTTAFAVDNYNYFVERDSDEKDDYYDVKDYGDREGSHGFVLYGTLNNLMQYATLYNNGNLSESGVLQYLSYRNMLDANLRMDASGTAPGALTEAPVRDKILAAARECQTSHRGEADYWNNELDCAELTYHQLQWYILDNRLYDRNTADGKLLTFCHLHAKCADLISTKPRNWEELVAAGRDNPDYIDQMSLDEINDMTNLRANSRGGKFGNVPTFKRRFSDAVQAGNEDWVSIQAYIAGGGDVDDFWWYDGATSNSAPTSLSALLNRTAPAIVPVTYPDGVARTTRAKLEPARTAFDANAALADQKVAPTWTKMTGNLVKAHYETPVTDPETGEVETVYTHDKFTDFEEFLDALLAAVEKAYDWSGGTLDPSALTWYQVQYAMLNPSEEFNSAPDPDADEAGFWWKDGKTPLKVSSIKTLLEAAKLSQSGDAEEKATGDAALAKVTVAMLEGENFWLRNSKTGEKWSDGGEMSENDLKALIQRIKDAQKAGATDWNTLQYYLAHGELLKKEDGSLNRDPMESEAFYYWWQKGGEGTEIDFSTASNLHQVIPPLVEAALRGDEFGDPKAQASVLAQMKDGSFYELTHLAKGIANDPNGNGPEKLTDLNWYTDMDELLGMVTALANVARGEQGITDPYTPPDLDWYQAQYWALEGKYIESETSEYAALEKTYWWYDKDEKPEEKPPEPEPTEAAIIPALEDYLKTGASAVTLVQADWTASGLKGKTQTATVTLAVAKKVLKRLADNAKDSEYYNATTGKLTLTWVQIQYYVASCLQAGAAATKDGELTSHADALAKLTAAPHNYSPSNFPANVIW